MEHTLRADVYGAVYGRDLVLLDTRAGNYSLFAGLGEALSFDPTHREFQVQDPAVVEALSEAGVLGSVQGTALSEDKTNSSPDRPTRSLPSSTPCSIAATWGEVGWLVRAWFSMAPHYYGRRLPHLIATARGRNRKAATHFDRSQDAHRLAAVFDQLSPWIPLQGACVFRCFLLLTLLQLRGRPDVRWVFGVRTTPFYAHCWLQLEDVALTDAADGLWAYSPIFVV